MDFSDSDFGSSSGGDDDDGGDEVNLDGGGSGDRSGTVPAVAEAPPSRAELDALTAAWVPGDDEYNTQIGEKAAPQPKQAFKAAVKHVIDVNEHLRRFSMINKGKKTTPEQRMEEVKRLKALLKGHGARFSTESYTR
jgi:hypothetical protein